MIAIINNPPPVRARASFTRVTPFFLDETTPPRIVLGVGLDEHGNGVGLCELGTVSMLPTYSIYMSDAQGVFLREIPFVSFKVALGVAEELCDAPLED